MATAITALAELTLGSSASTVTFSNIPATYRDLRIVVNAAVSAEGNLQIRVNGDTGNNYAQLRMLGYASTSYTSQASTTNSIVSNGATGLQTTARALNTYDILDYAQTDKNKAIIVRANHSEEVDALAARWASNSAITSVAVLAGSTFTSGSSFALYGIAS